MTIQEALEELSRQDEALLQMLDRISNLEGRVPGKILDRLISNIKEISARGEAIDKQLSDFLASTDQ